MFDDNLQHNVTALRKKLHHLLNQYNTLIKTAHRLSKGLEEYNAVEKEQLQADIEMIQQQLEKLTGHSPKSPSLLYAVELRYGRVNNRS